jgi:hypothetical protein
MAFETQIEGIRSGFSAFWLEESKVTQKFLHIYVRTIYMRPIYTQKSAESLRMERTQLGREEADGERDCDKVHVISSHRGAVRAP